MLVDLVRESMRDRPIPERIAVCAGVSGAGRAEEQEALTEALHDALSEVARSVHVEVVHDALIALDAAYDTDSGVIVIAGTGSVVLGRTTSGALVRAGGWGHLLGDPGSGYAIGRAGLQAVAEAFDGGEETLLQARLREQRGIEGRDDLIHAVYRDEITMQSVAPLVVEAAAGTDVVASGILDSQAADLTEQVRWLLERDESIAPRITLLGGMLENEHYAGVLRRRLHDHFSDWSVEKLQTEPVTGALRRARRLVRADVECRP